MFIYTEKKIKSCTKLSSKKESLGKERRRLIAFTLRIARLILCQRIVKKYPSVIIDTVLFYLR